MSNKLIGFAGQAGVGKDTAGNYFKLRGWKQYSFARPLKEMVAKMYGLPAVGFDIRELKEEKFPQPAVLNSEDIELFIKNSPIEIEESKLKEINKKMLGKEIHSWREMLQFVGTDICRECLDEEIWIKIGREKIGNMLKNVNVYITDIRFENEVKAVQELDGMVYIVERGDKEENGHSSEAIDFEANGNIDNNGSIQELHNKLGDLYDTKRKGTETKQAD